MITCTLKNNIITEKLSYRDGIVATLKDYNLADAMELLKNILPCMRTQKASLGHAQIQSVQSNINNIHWLLYMCISTIHLLLSKLSYNIRLKLGKWNTHTLTHIYRKSLNNTVYSL